MISFEKIVGGLVLLGLVFPVTASVIYDENVSGDIGPNPADLSLNLAIGENRVVGSTMVGDLGIDSDQLTIVLPGQTQLTAVTYSFFNVVLDGRVNDVGSSFTLKAPPPSFSTLAPAESIQIINSDRSIGASPVSLFVSSLPLQEQAIQWRLFGNSWAGTVSTDDQAYWDYDVNFQVASTTGGTVPEPTTLALIGLGLAGIGLARKKNKLNH